MTYTLLNDFQKAKECYEIAARINNIAYHAKYALAHICLMFEEIEEAEKYFDFCTDSEEIDAKAYYYLARIAVIKGETDKAINYLNLSIDLDDTFYEKIQKDNVFITIRDKVSKGNGNKRERSTNTSKNEVLVEEHLEKTSNIIGKLKNDDIQMIENVMRAKKEKEEKSL